MREQGISLVISSFSSEIFEKTIAYKKQKEEDRSMREQGISLIMSSFSSEIEDYSILEAERGGQKHEGARHITGNVLILLRN